jgi:hypothetical protein
MRFGKWLKYCRSGGGNGAEVLGDRRKKRSKNIYRLQRRGIDLLKQNFENGEGKEN